MATTSSTTSAALAGIDAKTSPATSVLDKNKSKVVGGTDANSKANSSGLKLADDFSSFLKMLTTQLQNQDPTQPMDTNQFTQQLVAFSGVEQSVATNSNLEKLISLTSNQQVSTAVSYIGKVVDAEGTQTALKNGKAEIAYTLPEGASKVTIGVLDKAGKPLFSKTITDAKEIKAGKQSFIWDGSNSFGNTKLPEGQYSFGVVATDAKGKVLTTKTYTSGKVTAVATENGTNTLSLENGINVALDKVLAVREAAVTNTTTPIITG
jgi:flagellar basal-body rod modification protein FlgD